MKVFSVVFYLTSRRWTGTRNIVWGDFEIKKNFIFDLISTLSAYPSLAWSYKYFIYFRKLYSVDWPNLFRDKIKPQCFWLTKSGSISFKLTSWTLVSKNLSFDEKLSFDQTQFSKSQDLPNLLLIRLRIFICRVKTKVEKLKVFQFNYRMVQSKNHEKIWYNLLYNPV